MISPLWKEHNGTLGKSIFWDPKYTLPLYLMAAWNIISEIWFCKGVLLWPLSHEVEKWTSKFGGGELLCNKPLQCSPLYCGSPRCNHPIYSAEAMTSQTTCFLHFIVFDTMYQWSMMKNIHSANLVGIGSWGPEIWSHEYQISPIEIIVNWPGSKQLWTRPIYTDFSGSN